MSMRLTGMALAVLALLAGCGEEQQELRGWMEEQRRRTPAVTEKIEPPKQFEPFRYAAEAGVDPFAQSRLALRPGEAPSSGLQPDLARRREALEGFPLDSIRMVGHVSDRRGSFALLQAEGMVYQARVGNHAGQNYGVITRVSESEVKLKELVRDAAGEWTQRETALQLQESRK